MDESANGRKEPWRPHSLSLVWWRRPGHRFAAVSLAGAADAAVSSSRWRWCLSWVVSVRKGGLSQWLCSLGLVGGGVVRGSGPPLALPPLPHQVINHNPQAAALPLAGGATSFCFFFRPLGGGGRTSSLCVWAALLGSVLQAEWKSA